MRFLPSRIRPDAWFVPVLVVLLLIFAAEIRAVLGAHRDATRSQARLQQRHREVDRLGADDPAASAERAAIIEQELARATIAWRAMERELKAPGDIAARWSNQPEPADRLEAFVDLSNFIERARAHAAAVGVEIRADESFGFSSYATEGPAPGLISAVFRQRLAAEVMVDALLECRPNHLIAIQREAPGASGTKDERPTRTSTVSPGGRTADFFAAEPSLSSRVPGVADAMAFRLIFVGSTGVLRSLLNRLSCGDLPVVVRRVEVEPASGSGGLAADAARVGNPPALRSPAPVSEEAGGAITVASPALSKFTVTVEFIGLGARGESSATEQPAHPAA
jgi:hypothetical protein